MTILTLAWIDPIAFHFGPLAVRWYGLAYVAAFVISYWMLRVAIRRKTLPLSRERLDELLFWLVVGVIVGGRLGWWLFYRPTATAFDSWYEPFAIWHGGMSFHGGLAGVAIATFIWTRYRQVPVWNLLDHLALAAPIGLMLGRIANFINAELIGRPSDLPWAIVFPGESLARHPSQLYEALLEGPVLLLSLLVVRKLLPARNGLIAAAFLVFYGLFRFMVEFTRQPDPQVGFVGWGWLTMGQILSSVIAAIGLALVLKRAHRRHSDTLITL
jgi:phosphatidylglycerol:prolipoprotein diacylglycerol transferase